CRRPQLTGARVLHSGPGIRDLADDLSLALPDSKRCRRPPVEYGVGRDLVRCERKFVSPAGREARVPRCRRDEPPQVIEIVYAEADLGHGDFGRHQLDLYPLDSALMLEDSSDRPDRITSRRPSAPNPDREGWRKDRGRSHDKARA